MMPLKAAGSNIFFMLSISKPVLFMFWKNGCHISYILLYISELFIMFSNASLAVFGFMNFGISPKALFMLPKMLLPEFIQFCCRSFRFCVLANDSYMVRLASIMRRAASFCILNQFWKKSAPGIVLLVCCLLYTSDAADERSSVDLGGR